MDRGRGPSANEFAESSTKGQGDRLRQAAESGSGGAASAADKILEVRDRTRAADPGGRSGAAGLGGRHQKRVRSRRGPSAASSSDSTARKVRCSGLLRPTRRANFSFFFVPWGRGQTLLHCRLRQGGTARGDVSLEPRGRRLFDDGTENPGGVAK